MPHYSELDVRDRMNHNGIATFTLVHGETAWNPQSEKDPLMGPKEGFVSVVEYQEFPDGSWSARVTDPSATETHYRSDR